MNSPELQSGELKDPKAVEISLTESQYLNLLWSLGIAEGGLNMQGRTVPADLVHRTFIAVMQGTEYVSLKLANREIRGEVRLK